MRRSLVALALAVTLPLPVLAGQVTVKEGETLSQIAERHGISLSRLMQINGIRNADQVVAGQTLKLGSAAQAPAQSSRAVAASGSVTVKPGETLSELAERHGLSLSQLMEINGIRNADQVVAGQTLRLRAAAQAPARTASAVTPTPAAYPRDAKEHVVRPGESLSAIANRDGIGMSKLIALNAISDPDLVTIGTRLKVKGTPAAAPARAASGDTAAASAVPRRQEPAASASRAVAVATANAAAPAAVARSAGTPTSASATRRTTTDDPGVPPKPSLRASRPAAAAVPEATTVAMASPDWRTYGPLQVNWAGWQPMGGSMVAPTLNNQGQTLYVAINCGARKFNSTTPSGEWQSWNDPSGDYEQQLVSDYCRSRS